MVDYLKWASSVSLWLLYWYSWYSDDPTEEYGETYVGGFFNMVYENTGILGTIIISAVLSILVVMCCVLALAVAFGLPAYLDNMGRSQERAAKEEAEQKKGK